MDVADPFEAPAVAAPSAAAHAAAAHAAPAAAQAQFSVAAGGGVG